MLVDVRGRGPWSLLQVLAEHPDGRVLGRTLPNAVGKRWRSIGIPLATLGRVSGPADRPDNRLVQFNRLGFSISGLHQKNGTGTVELRNLRLQTIPCVAGRPVAFRPEIVEAVSDAGQLPVIHGLTLEEGGGGLAVLPGARDSKLAQDSKRAPESDRSTGIGVGAGSAGNPAGTGQGSSPASPIVISGLRVVFDSRAISGQEVSVWGWFDWSCFEELRLLYAAPARLRVQLRLEDWQPDPLRKQGVAWFVEATLPASAQPRIWTVSRSRLVPFDQSDTRTMDWRGSRRVTLAILPSADTEQGAASEQPAGTSDDPESSVEMVASQAAGGTELELYRLEALAAPDALTADSTCPGMSGER